MRGTFFLDSSALIKLYHQEPGTERVEEIFAATDTSLVISELAAVELQSTLARKVRTGEITLRAEEEVVRNFEQDCADRLVIEPLRGPYVLSMPSRWRPSRSCAHVKRQYSSAPMAAYARSPRQKGPPL